MGACETKPSEQNPEEQTWPIGQWFVSKQGNLADAPDILGAAWDPALA